MTTNAGSPELLRTEDLQETLYTLLETLRALDAALGTTDARIDARKCSELLRGLRELAALHVTPPVQRRPVPRTNISCRSVRLLLIERLPKMLGRFLVRLRESPDETRKNEHFRTAVIRHLVGIHVTANALLASPTFRRRDTLPGVGDDASNASGTPRSPSP